LEELDKKPGKILKKLRKLPLKKLQLWLEKLGNQLKKKIDFEFKEKIWI